MLAPAGTVYAVDDSVMDLTTQPSAAGTANCTFASSTSTQNYYSCTASASPGYSFTSWWRSLTGATWTDNPRVIPCKSSSTCLITAVFTGNTYTVSSSANPSAGGSAICTPSTVTYPGGSSCTASASPGYTFTSWSGDCSGTSATCVLSSFTANQSATAVFTASAPTVTTVGQTTATYSGNCAGFGAASVTAPGAGAPAGVFPYGVFDFTIIGCPVSGGSATITMTYPTLQANAPFWKDYGGGRWENWAANGRALQTGNTFTFTINDGSDGDLCPASDTICDPVGPQEFSSAAVPFLPNWALVILSLLTLGVARWGPIRQRQNRE